MISKQSPSCVPLEYDIFRRYSHPKFWLFCQTSPWRFCHHMDYWKPSYTQHWYVRLKKEVPRQNWYPTLCKFYRKNLWWTCHPICWMHNLLMEADELEVLWIMQTFAPNFLAAFLLAFQSTSSAVVYEIQISEALQAVFGRLIDQCRYYFKKEMSMNLKDYQMFVRLSAQHFRLNFV